MLNECAVLKLVREVKNESVDAAVFDIQFPAGTYVLDEFKQEAHLIGGVGQADKWVENIGARASQPGQPLAPGAVPAAASD